MFFIYLKSSLKVILHIRISYKCYMCKFGGRVVKNSPVNAGDMGIIPELRRYPGVGNGNPFHYSCLGSPMHRGAWRAIVHGISKSQTWLSNWTCTIINQINKRDSGEIRIIGSRRKCWKKVASCLTNPHTGKRRWVL